MPRTSTKRSARNDSNPRKAGPRPYWSGSISFGLVSLPVDFHATARLGGGPSTTLRMLAPDGTPLRRRYVCPEDGRELDAEDLVRGYEFEDGEIVPVTDEELEALAPRRSRDVELTRFVELDELDPFLFDRVFILTPAGASTKPYRLLADVLSRTRKAGIARAVIREQETLIALLAEKGILRAQTLRFPADVRAPDDVGLPKPRAAPGALTRAYRRALKGLRRPNLDREELADERASRLRELVARKRRRGRQVLEAPAEKTPPEDAAGAAESAGGTTHLMESIRASLAAGNERTATPSAKKREEPAVRRAAKPGAKPAGKAAAKRPARSDGAA